MTTQKEKNTSPEADVSFRDIKREPFHKFNLAFALMSVIPFLVFLYLLVTQLFSIDIVIGNIGVVLVITFTLAITGYCVGYFEIRDMLRQIISYLTKTKSAYAELKETQVKLIQSEKFKVIGQLASGIAHEVKNPLGTILQDVVYLEENLTPEKDIPKVLDMMKRNIERADAIVNALLDFSRISKVDIIPQDINSIIDSSMLLMRHKVELENIKFAKDMKEDLPKILADRAKIEQVFVNLFLNAIEAMPKGGTLFIRSYLTQLNKLEKGVGRRREDFFKTGETAVAVEVEDTGVGIPEKDLSRVYEPFFTMKKEGKGTGMGLTITKNIIEMHQGLIGIESQEGKGTKVTLVFKISQGPPDDAPSPEGDGKIIEKKKIMIIDDEEDFLEITKLNLEKTNKFEILALSSAKEIMRQFYSFKPDVILLDILMPEIDGIEVCKMLNSDPVGKNTPIIILSALGKDHDKLKAYKVGIVDYQVKPILKDALISKIEKALLSKSNKSQEDF